MAVRTFVHLRTETKARRLGVEMATDPAIRPNVVNVEQYEGYFRFRLAHRAQLEQGARFERYYQERIFELADQEGRTRRRVQADSMSTWDRWYHELVHPIKCLVWQEWEARVNLEARYLDALLVSGKANAADIRRMTSAPESDPDELPVSVADHPGFLVSARNALGSLFYL